MTVSQTHFIGRRDVLYTAGLSTLAASGLGGRSGIIGDLYGEPIVLSKMGVRARTFADETSLVQDAIDLALQSRRPLLIDIAVRVSGLRIRGANGLLVFQTAPIVGLHNGGGASLLSFENSSDVSWCGRLWLSCQWNPDYDAAVVFRADPGTITGNVTIQDWSITGARVAFQFGHGASKQGAISEISILGGFSYGCPTVVEASGAETVVSFAGSNLIANHLGGGERWSRISSNAVHVAGAHLTISGGEVQHNDGTEGAAFFLKPYKQDNATALFGSVVVIGSAIEAAGPFLATEDIDGVTVDQETGHFFAEGCVGYHSQRDIPFISLTSQFGGRVKIGSGCYFRAGAQRVVPIVKNAGRAKVDVPNEAFNALFKPVS